VSIDRTLIVYLNHTSSVPLLISIEASCWHAKKAAFTLFYFNMQKRLEFRALMLCIIPHYSNCTEPISNAEFAEQYIFLHF